MCNVKANDSKWWLEHNLDTAVRQSLQMIKTISIDIINSCLTHVDIYNYIYIDI